MNFSRKKINTNVLKQFIDQKHKTKIIKRRVYYLLLNKNLFKIICNNIFSENSIVVAFLHNSRRFRSSHRENHVSDVDILYNSSILI